MRLFRWFLGMAVVLAMAVPALARMRPRYEDAQVVERSELIVVGSIKEGSVVVVPHHRANPDAGRSWETHAVLVVKEVTKGELKEKEIPIVIRYGLDVVVDGKGIDGGLDDAAVTLPAAKKSMEILDTGNSSRGGPAVAEDARKEHLWFLRHGGARAEGDDKGFGIEDPEDVQPLNLREYFECYLKADPEGAVRAKLQEQPEIGARALRYLEHCEVGRILAEKDAAVRVERLLPYYRSRVDWGYREESRDGILAAGEVAGPYLMGVYQETNGERQEDVMTMWGRIRWRGCVEVLVNVLTREDAFWAKQAPELKAGWWNADADSALTKYRQESYGRVYSAAYALSQIADPRGKAALEMTRARWAGIGFENSQIVETCDAGLKLMGGEKMGVK